MKITYTQVKDWRDNFQHLAAAEGQNGVAKRLFFTASGYQVEFCNEWLETTSLKTAVDTYNLLDFDQFGKGDYWDTWQVGNNGVLKLQVQRIDEPAEHDPLESDEIAYFLAKCSGMRLDSEGFVL